MNIFNIVACILIVAVVAKADVVENGKTYVIRSSMDGGYLLPTNSGRVCDHLSQIVAIYRSDSEPFANEYKWTIWSNVINYKYQLHNDGPEEGHIVNELSYGDYPPFCFLKDRNIDLVPNPSNTAYRIVNVVDGKCLSHYGSEVGIMFWTDCGGSGVAQEWIFQEAIPPPKQ